MCVHSESRFCPFNSYNCFETFLLIYLKRENGSRKEKKNLFNVRQIALCLVDAGEDDDFLVEKFIPNLLFVCQNWIKSKYDLEKNG